MEDDGYISEIQASAARLRRRIVVTASLGALAAVVAGAGWWLWPTGAKTLEANRPLIERVHDRYCAAFAQIDGADPTAHPLTSPPSEALVLPAFHDLNDGDIARRDPRENADGIDWEGLRELCADGAGGPPVAFHSLFARVDRIGSPRADEYDAQGVELALETVRELEWLVVLVPSRVLDSRVVDEQTFEGGEMSGWVWLCHLEDGRCLGAMRVQSSGPISAMAFGPGRANADLAVAAETTSAFRRSVLFYLREAGVRIEEGDGFR